MEEEYTYYVLTPTGVMAPWSWSSLDAIPARIADPWGAVLEDKFFDTATATVIEMNQFNRETRRGTIRELS